jgi:hypothetical protein
MRSVAEPRVFYEGSVSMVAPSGTQTGRTTNVSIGGAFVKDVLQREAGELVAVSIDLGDGQPAMTARACIVWSRTRDEAEGPAGVALRFLEMEDDSARRIAELVSRRAQAPSSLSQRRVRVRVPDLAVPLRAMAREITSDVVTVEAELPWLQLGATVSAELAPTDTRVGRLKWVGINLSPSGTAELRLAIDVSSNAVLSVLPPAAPQPAIVFSDAGPVPRAPVPFTPPQLRPRFARKIAFLVGIALGCAGGAGLNRVRPHLPRPSIVTAILGPAPQIIDEDPGAPDLPPPHFESPHRVIPKLAPPAPAEIVSADSR